MSFIVEDSSNRSSTLVLTQRPPNVIAADMSSQMFLFSSFQSKEISRTASSNVHISHRTEDEINRRFRLLGTDQSWTLTKFFNLTEVIYFSLWIPSLTIAVERDGEELGGMAISNRQKAISRLCLFAQEKKTMMEKWTINTAGSTRRWGSLYVVSLLRIS